MSETGSLGRFERVSKDEGREKGRNGWDSTISQELTGSGNRCNR